MIISASRRTDIPAFFGDWFMKRIEEGYVYRINPFNSKQVKSFPIRPEDVDAIVFWTKNPKPFAKHLDQLDTLGYNYYFTYTLNPYPIIFEPHLPPLEDRIETLKQLSDRIGNRRVIWRYDPIIISNITPIEYHLDQIENMAKELKGFTQRIVVSFLDFYGKVERRLKALEEQGIQFIDITSDEHRERLLPFTQQIKAIADQNEMEVFTCSESIDLDHVGIAHGSCIDGKLLQQLFGLRGSFQKDKNQRKECQCVESIDIGVYNTCRFDCTYCYANRSKKAVENTLKKHNPNHPALIGE